ncbi:NAD(P)H-binding protein [Bradyrhizobium sp. WSM2793]|uniref:NmrA family NAD(P)-binding protein n=1 Tax=Bradyrhizobium sp. WSM2793 TaxID=1038866 RepID=UPI000367A625|nr:NAD(P)H-binding protein [Bradyrhizobium sp. WSM2793]
MLMYVIMGGTGHIGSATANILLSLGKAVTIVSRNSGHAGGWRKKGAEIVEADLNDVSSLHAALRRGRRALLLNPPADPTTDTDAVEKRTVASILEALAGSGLEKVVAVSTGGAQSGDRIGDLNTLWEFEEGLRRQPIPTAINRGAYYMSNWDGLLDTVRATGKLPSMFPAELSVPMVAPQDLGRFAADRLLSGTDDVGVRYMEGPERYSPADVARAFSEALGRPIDVEVKPRAEWYDGFLQLGFSEAAALSYTRMTELCVDNGFDMPADASRGAITLERYIDSLVVRAAKN